MHVLITGGAGFIGSHLAEVHLSRGHTVTAFDNLSTGRIENVAHLRGGPNFTFIEGSILDREAIGAAARACDAVHHLAAAVGVKYIMEHPFDAIRTNVTGTENVFEAAAGDRKRVLITSTSEIYGKQTKAPLREDDDRILGPTHVNRWSYASTKALDEFLALAYHQECGLDVVIVRLFNVVGPRQTGDYGMVLPRFVQQALAGEPITVYGDGSQTRTFTHVSDATRALADLLECPEAGGEIYNLGGVDEVAIGELARRVKRATGSSSPIVNVPYERAYDANFQDMPRRVPDIRKIQRVVHFRPETDLDEMIRSVVKFLQDA